MLASLRAGGAPLRALADNPLGDPHVRGNTNWRSFDENVPEHAARLIHDKKLALWVSREGYHRDDAVRPSTRTTGAFAREQQWLRL